MASKGTTSPEKVDFYQTNDDKTPTEGRANAMPVLSKVKIGDTKYAIKDAEGRAELAELEGRLGTAAYVSRDEEIQETSTGVAATSSVYNYVEGVRTEVAAEATARATADTSLSNRIDALEGRGRFLSSWNANTGLPADYPVIPEGATSPYTYNYKVGDYYIVGTANDGTKYQPSGASISATKSGDTWTWTIGKAAETRAVNVGDYYICSTISGTTATWVLIGNATKTIAFNQITGAARDNTSLNTEITALEAADTALSGRIAVYEGAKDGYDDAVAKKHEHSNKSELDLIASGDKAKWDAAAGQAHEHSNKAILDGIKAENLLDDESGSGNAKKSKLEGIAAGAQVNVIENIKIGTTEASIASKVASFEAQAAGELATLNASNLEVDIAQQNVTGASATFTGATGSISISSTPTAIASTGKFTPAGSVAVTLSGHTFNAITAVGTLPEYTAETITGGKATVVDVDKFNGGTQASFTEGTFTPNTPTVIDTTKFNAGAKATYSHSGFSGGSLGDATTSKFAKKIAKFVVGTGEDAECLILSYVDSTDTGLASNFADAVTAQGEYTAAVYGTDTFDGGTLPSLGDGFYTAGTAASKAADQFTANTIASLAAGFVTAGSDVSYTASSYTPGTLPTMSSNTVAIATQTFTGTEGDLSVAGSYDKASGTASFIPSGTISVSGGSVAAHKGTVSKKA